VKGGLVVLGVLLVAAFAIGTAVSPGSQVPDDVLRFQDPRIVESSGLVVVGDLFVTTNDSGDSGRVFAVDRDGRTAGVTTWAAEPEDVEALAPAGPAEVWVGDIGDNPGNRESITVARVPVGAGDRTVDPTTYELVYPDGPRDAEALLAHPSTGRLYVVSKLVFGGVVYAAPQRLDPDEPNRLREVGPVVGIVTDGTFMPGGRHLVLRTYDRAVVYSFPDLEMVGEMSLPEQRQGEGIAVDADGELYVSSEGLRSALLRLTPPDDVRDLLAGAPSGATPAADDPSESPSASVSEPPGEDRPPEAPRQEAKPDVQSWLVGFGVLGAIVVVLLLALRRPR
jgi:hypothetical protein